MSPTYAFIAGAILMALAVLRIVWFLWRGSATREARSLGMGAALFMYFGGAALLVVCGMCFWGWGAMTWLELRTPRPGLQLGQPYPIPKPISRLPLAGGVLKEAIELEPGFWIHPPSDFVAEPVRESEVDGHRRRVHCWRHPKDPKQLMAFAFTDDDAPCSFLSAGAVVGDSARGMFLNDHYDRLRQELGSPVLTLDGDEYLSNFDGLLMFHHRTGYGRKEYVGGHYAGCDGGRLIEYIWCVQEHHGGESTLRSLERRGAKAENSFPKP
jgi:hypothetical protein